MIYIDFQAGSHGRYLEFVCNRFLAQIPVITEKPFDQFGSSHAKEYAGQEVFTSGHYERLQDKRVLTIRISFNDLLPLSMISLLRAGNRHIDNENLEIDTFNKLNNDLYSSVLTILLDGYFNDQVVISYNQVKSETWPDITSLNEFNQLPDWIKQECLEVHKLELLELSSENPNCPRYILRDFFKRSFDKPYGSGFMKIQNNLEYKNCDVFYFPFGAFYSTNKFISIIKEVGSWSGYALKDEDKLIELHTEFLSKQPYKDSKKDCDQIIDNVYYGVNFTLPKMDLICEAYLSSQFENSSGIESPYYHWFTTSKEIQQHYKL